jgi:hypothetical protein
MKKIIRLLSAAAAIAVLSSLHAAAHGTEARYVEVFQWNKPHIARVFGVATAGLGVPSFSRQTVQMRVIENK